jgi:hypothetical protein
MPGLDPGICSGIIGLPQIAGTSPAMTNVLLQGIRASLRLEVSRAA